MSVTMDLGKVGVLYKGTHDSTQTYERNDIVMSNGSGYIAKQNVPVGIAISNSSYWGTIVVGADSSVFATKEYTASTYATIDDVSALQAAVGSPLVASTVAEMTDEEKVYVYTGSETGYTSGNWYFYDGEAWVSGGIYNSQGIGDGSITTAKLADGAVTDAKLAQSGGVLEEVADLKSALSEVWDVQKYHLSNAVAQVYSYTFEPNKTYYVTNKTSGSTVAVRTCDSNGDLIEWIKNGIAYGETIKFIPTLNANYFRVYCVQMSCDVEISTKGEVIESIENAISDVDTKVDNLSVISGNITQYKNWELYQKPQEFSADIPLNIFTDGHSYITDYNKEKYKNESANTYYISPSGANTNAGTISAPWKTLFWAVSHVSSGDTIIMLEGDYDRNSGDLATGSIKKSLNIIGDGKVRIFNGDFVSFTAVSGYTNVYKGTRSSGLAAYEVDSVDGEVLLLTLVNSIAEVQSAIGSYYKEGNDYYIHPIKSGVPNSTGAKIFISVDTAECLSFDNSEQDVKAYIENLTIIGSTKSCLFDRQSASNSFDICLDHVNFMYCGYGTRNVVGVYGGNVVINECSIFGSYRDGFNYCGTDTRGVTYREGLYIEINCEASNCGIGRTETNMNGSTGHRNSKIVRVNCTYHDNHGPNCCDVQSDTESINLGCIAYNSTAEPNAANHNFDCQTEGAKMWLENCIGLGSYVDFYSPSDGSMYMDRCSYDTKSGAGIVDTNPITPMEWMLRNYNNSEQILRR